MDDELRRRVAEIIDPDINFSFPKESVPDSTVKMLGILMDRKKAAAHRKAEEIIKLVQAQKAREPTGALMPDGSRLSEWDERLRIVDGVPLYEDDD